MSLLCGTCMNAVPEGFNQCLVCKAGYVPELICTMCRRAVPRGQAVCACEAKVARQPAVLPTLPAVPGASAISLERRSSHPMSSGTVVVGFVAPIAAPPAMPGLPAHVRSIELSEEYKAGKFGVTATVFRSPKDVEILNKLGQTVVLLHTMAQEMNQLQGHSEHTRALIRAMRNLATDIQDEIEIRTGPPG